jgi:hypothetical protein
MKTKSITFIASVAGIALLTACGPVTTAQNNPPATSVIDRALEMHSIIAFNDCATEGKARDVAASNGQDQALYLSSADMLMGCDATLGDSTVMIDQRDRMQIAALAVQNYLKGGDVAKSRLALDDFQKRFGSSDLIFADGSSFTDTMHALLFQHERPEQLALSSLNAKSSVKDEIRRSWYWQQN